MIDPEEFVDFQATRPTVRLSGGQHRVIEWPDIEVHEARVPRAPRDLVILSGPEPAYRWRTFCATVVELAEALGVQMVVTLGALLADVPHSRPVGVTAFASDDALVERLELEPPTYEGPTGIVGVLHDACANAGMPSASLWAAVPHYVAVVPNPKGSLALLRRLESLVGVTVDAAELEDAAGEYERQVSRAVEMDPDVQAFVEKLERTADEEEGRPDPSQLPVRRRARARVPALPAPARQRAGLAGRKTPVTRRPPAETAWARRCATRPHATSELLASRAAGSSSVVLIAADVEALLAVLRAPHAAHAELAARPDRARRSPPRSSRRGRSTPARGIAAACAVRDRAAQARGRAAARAAPSSAPAGGSGWSGSSSTRRRHRAHRRARIGHARRGAGGAARAPTSATRSARTSSTSDRTARSPARTTPRRPSRQRAVAARRRPPALATR